MADKNVHMLALAGSARMAKKNTLFDVKMSLLLGFGSSLDSVKVTLGKISSYMAIRY